MLSTVVVYGRLRLFAAIAAAVPLASVAVAPPAAAQQVVARVNGEPITAIDLAQRTRLIQASSQKAPARKDVLDELIDEQLKMQTLQRYRIEIPEAEVDNVLAGMASRMRVNPTQFAEALGKSGISVNALKRKIKADIGWQQIVRGKFQASLRVGDRDIAMTLESRGKKTNETATEYTLRPILLIVPKGSAETGLENRRREAEGLRNRFQSCDDGIQLARGLKDVAVRDPITKTSADLAPKLREVLDATAVGRLTPPDVTPQGIEVFAVCKKREIKGDTGGERDVREELFGQRFTAQGKKYLEELRRTAAVQLY